MIRATKRSARNNTRRVRQPAAKTCCVRGRYSSHAYQGDKQSVLGSMAFKAPPAVWFSSTYPPAHPTLGEPWRDSPGVKCWLGRCAWTLSIERGSACMQAGIRKSAWHSSAAVCVYWFCFVFVCLFVCLFGVSRTDPATHQLAWHRLAHSSHAGHRDIVCAGLGRWRDAGNGRVVQCP